MVKVYGLKNCDTCRKARRWLDENGIGHSFLDVRADGVSAGEIAEWADAAGWETLLNRRGTTWRGLGDADRAVAGSAGAVALMARHPALIRRPVFVARSGVLVGFDDRVREKLGAA